MASERTAGLAVYGTQVEPTVVTPTPGAVMAVSKSAPGAGKKYRVFGYCLSCYNAGSSNNYSSWTWFTGIEGGDWKTSATNQNIGTPGKANTWDTMDLWPPGLYMDATTDNAALLLTVTTAGTTPQLAGSTVTFYTSTQPWRP